MTQTYTFISSPYNITTTHQKKRHPKYNYIQETIHISCQSKHSTYEGMLDADSIFQHFQNLNQLYVYLRKNKNKSIMQFDGCGLLNIRVENNDQLQGIETIGLIKIQKIQTQGKKETYLQSLDRLKTKLISKLEKTMKEAVDHKTMEMKKSKAIQTLKQLQLSFKVNNLNTLNSQPNVEYLILTSNPIYEFKIQFEELIKSGFKITISKMISQKLIFGIKYTKTQSKQQVRHECQFKKSFLGSFQVDNGHELEIYFEDESDLVIRNNYNNNGKMFERSSRDTLSEECTVYVSLFPTVK